MNVSIADLIIFTGLLVAAMLAYRLKKLTLAGAITGAIVGILIFKGGGGIGLAMLA